LNASYLFDPEICFAADARAIAHFERDQRWLEHAQKIIPEHSLTKRNKHVFERTDYYVARLARRRDNPWTSSLSAGLFRGNNSGLLALHLAEVLCADPIFLLGFDMRGADGRSAQWHEAYPDQWSQDENVYQRFIESFSTHAVPNVKATVYNCCPDSAMQFWPRIEIGEIWTKIDDSARARGEAARDRRVGSSPQSAPTGLGSSEGHGRIHHADRLLPQKQ
jgi:hypothetical protein